MLAFLRLFAGPFAPRKSSSVSIGEFAADVRAAVTRKLNGQPAPEPDTAPMDIDRILKLGAVVLAGLAMIGGATALLMREQSPLAILAISFGAGTMLVQFVIWLAFLVMGVMIIGFILKNMDGILGA